MRGDPIPWKKSDLTPNLGDSPDTDRRHARRHGPRRNRRTCRKFIDAGGLFITITGNASIPIDYGLIEGVILITSPPGCGPAAACLNATIADKRSPIAYGYGDKLAIYFNQAPVFQVSSASEVAGRGGRGGEPAGAHRQPPQRARRTPTEQDIPQGRPLQMGAPARAAGKPGEEPPLEAGGARSGAAESRCRPKCVPASWSASPPRTSCWSPACWPAAANWPTRPAVVDVPRGKGHVLMFANNPMWRNETQGSYFLLFNAMLNFDHLGAGLEGAK